MDRQALIAAIENSRAELNAALEGLTVEQLMAPGAAGEWSVKDILAHITAWEVDLLTNLGRVKRGQKPGRIVWDAAAIEDQNAKWWAEYRDRPLERVMEDFRGVHRQVLRQVAAMSDKDLAAPVGWRRGEPMYQFFMVYVVNHETEHLAALKAWRQQVTRGPNGAH
jgi:hypothetical protein